MKKHNDRKKWVIIGTGGFVILVLLISLMVLIFSKDKLPDNAVIVSEELIEGEKNNQETLKKLNALFEKEPVLKNLPITVEYYSDNYTKYTKYILSYQLDDSEKGFLVIMKDYTGEGSEVGIKKLREMGMDLAGIKMIYKDFTDSGLNHRAE